MFILKVGFYSHQKTCTLKPATKPTENNPSARRPRHQQQSSTLLPASSEAAVQFKSKILPTLHVDDVSFTVHCDELIVKYGSRLFCRHGHEQHMHQYIKQKMRELGCLVTTMRGMTPEVHYLSGCIDHKMHSELVDAVKTTCQFDH